MQLGLQVKLISIYKPLIYSRQKHSMLNFKIGIGIHSGTVTLGTLGGKERMDTTVIGNAVGIAKKN
jgi:adenylate cyclase